MKTISLSEKPFKNSLFDISTKKAGSESQKENTPTILIESRIEGTDSSSDKSKKISEYNVIPLLQNTILTSTMTELATDSLSQDHGAEESLSSSSPSPLLSPSLTPSSHGSPSSSSPPLTPSSYGSPSSSSPPLTPSSYGSPSSSSPPLTPSSYGSSSSSQGSSTPPAPNPDLPILPNGLKLFMESRDRPPFVATPQSYRPGDIIMGRYLYIRDKRFGVEPGFEGVKIWTAKDNAHLQAPKLAEIKPRYFQAISEFIIAQIETDPVYQYFAELSGLDKNNPLDVHAIVDYIRMSGNAHVNETMRLYAEEHLLKFHKLHYIKLDYPEPESGSVSIPLERAKKTSDTFKTSSPGISRFIRDRLPFVDSIGQRLHQQSRAGSVREMNLSAVTESLANDIYEAWGFGGQNLRILHAHYQNGQSKLLLDGAHVQGRQGEPFSTLEGQIKHGQLIGNCVRDKDGRLYPVDSRELARAKAKALLMGDFDKIGSGGGNLGFVVEHGQAKLRNIDPGKSLESKPNITQDDVSAGRATSAAFFTSGKTDRMTQRNLHTDLSFDQPDTTLKDRAAKGYKNFTVFDDTLLSERIQGMQDVLDCWLETMLIFNSYVRAFNSKDVDISFRKELTETYKRLLTRTRYFKRVLKERLALLKLGPEKLDFLDNIEKLTSDTVDHVGPDDDSVGLRHLRVVRETRKEWHMVQKPEGGYELWYDGTEEDTISTRVALQAFLQRNPTHISLVDQISRNGTRVKIDIENDDQLSQFMEAINERAIASYKGQKLIDYTAPQLDLISRFEKLTSPTVPATEGCCSSELQIVVPATRRRWELSPIQEGGYQLVFEGRNVDEEFGVRRALTFFNSSYGQIINVVSSSISAEYHVVVRIENDSAIETLLQRINEETIKGLKEIS